MFYMRLQVCAHMCVITNWGMPQWSDSFKVIYLVSSMTQGLSLVYILSHHTMNPSHPGWHELSLSTKEILSSPADKGNRSFLASQPELLSSTQHPKRQSWSKTRSWPSPSQQVTESDSESLAGWWARLVGLAQRPRQAGRQAVVVGGQRQSVASPISYYA